MTEHICAGCGNNIKGETGLKYLIDNVIFHPKADKIAELADKQERMSKLRQGQLIPQDCLSQDVKGDCVMAYMLKGHAIAYNSENFKAVRL